MKLNFINTQQFSSSVRTFVKHFDAYINALTQISPKLIWNDTEIPSLSSVINLFFFYYFWWRIVINFHPILSQRLVVDGGSQSRSEPRWQLPPTSISSGTCWRPTADGHRHVQHDATRCDACVRSVRGASLLTEHPL